MPRRPATRAVAATAAALGVLVLLPDVALAHASFDVRQLPAGSSQELVLRVPLEREATNDRVEVLVPGGFTVDRCDGAAGWSCQQDATTDGDTLLTFERAPDGPGDTERFAVTVTAPQDEGVYPFPTIQTYDDGEEAAWIGEPGSDHPAPRVQVGDETTPIEFSGDATPHTATGAPSAASTASAVPSPDATTSEAVTDITPAPDGDADDRPGEVAIGGAALTIAAILVAVVAAAVTAVLLRRRRG